MKPSEYDGFYFVPSSENEEDLKISYFSFTEQMAGGVPLDASSIGDCYHIALFSVDDDFNPEFRDSFEAILIDPSVYVKNLAGNRTGGCIVRKTNKSVDWFKDYLQSVLIQIMSAKKNAE